MRDSEKPLDSFDHYDHVDGGSTDKRIRGVVCSNECVSLNSCLLSAGREWNNRLLSLRGACCLGHLQISQSSSNPLPIPTADLPRPFPLYPRRR